MQSNQISSPPASTAPSRPVVTGPAQALAGVASSSWGWLPALTLSSACGLVLVGLAMARAGFGLPGGEFLLWLGLVTLFAPITLRQSMPGVSRRERIGLVLCLGVSLYIVKVIRSPLGFVFHDEFPHWRTASDIVQSGYLFGYNPLQPVSASYPGLEIITAAIVQLTGLTISQAGTMVVGVARLIGVLAVYLILADAGRSQRLAGIGASLYMTYPNFVFWSSQFAYESLALPLALLLIYVVLHFTGRDRDEHRGGALLLGLLVVAAVVASHHLTSYALLVFLIAAAAAQRWHRPLLRIGVSMVDHVPPRLRRWLAFGETNQALDGPAAPASVPWGVFAAATLVAATAWLLLVGPLTISYLAPHFEAALLAVTGLILRGQAVKPLFNSSAPVYTTPLWERLAAATSVLLILLALPLGVSQLWRRNRERPVALVMAASALAYPVTLVLRLTGAGSEIGNRALDFLFLPVSFVLAAAAGQLLSSREHRGARRSLFIAGAVAIFLGGATLGMPIWSRLPGPYLVGGDTSAIQPESLAAASWTRDVIGPYNTIIADDTNGLLLGSYGEQNPLTGLSWVYLSPAFRTGFELADLRKAGVRYIVVDRRLSMMPSKTGFYFEIDEPRPAGPLQPIPSAWLAKFDRVPYLSRVLDSGNIVIYDTHITGPGQ